MIDDTYGIRSKIWLEFWVGKKLLGYMTSERKKTYRSNKKRDYVEYPLNSQHLPHYQYATQELPSKPAFTHPVHHSVSLKPMLKPPVMSLFCLQSLFEHLLILPDCDLLFNLHAPLVHPGSVFPEVLPLFPLSDTC